MQHRRGKNHKRRCKSLKEVPFSQQEADAAIGLGVEGYLEASKSLESQSQREGRKADDSAMEIELREETTEGRRHGV